MNWKTLLVIGLIAYGSYHTWHGRAVTHGPGVIAASDPIQSEISRAAPIEKNGYQLTPLAEFQAEARVLSSDSYHLDRESDLASVDLALGWGHMSDEAILKNIQISQSGRFYFWHTDQFRIPREEIETHSANMHMIPADSSVESALKSVRPGQVVNFSGYLVEARATDGWRWKSSLSRNDTGNGSCELVYVKSLSVR